MLRSELLEILSAPGTDSPLEPSDFQLGDPRTGKKYPVREDIPVFVEQEGLRDEKKLLQSFYEEFGWQRPEAGGFYKAQTRYGFGSPTLLEHRRIVNRAQSKYFDPSGRFFLDCASGAIPAKEYLEYSSGYDFHVCVDITLAALAGARERLGDRGLYVNADGTKLPFRSNTFDAILSSHTLYHMPKDEQERALAEFCRVLKPGKKCILYYNVGENSVFGRVLRPLVWAKRFRAQRATGEPHIYSYHYPKEWFRRFVGPGAFSAVDFHVYRLLPNQAMKYLLPDTRVTNLVGAGVLPVLRKVEDALPLTSISQYLTVVFSK